MTGLNSTAVGLHRLHADSHLNFELNRMVLVSGGDLSEVAEAGGRIRDLDDWKDEFLRIAEVAERQRRIRQAAAYYRAAEFFMPAGDPDKASAYDAQAQLAREALAQSALASEWSEEHVEMGSVKLPAWRWRPSAATLSAGVVVIHGGFDSYIEEFLLMASHLHDIGHEVVIFEGPGQGAVIRRQGIPFTAQWERPVGALLDHFGLKDVTLMGVSLGGCLALRAAAAEPRVRRVIACDALYDLYDAWTCNLPRGARAWLRVLMGLRARLLINRAARHRGNRDPLARWAVDHGCYVMGAADTYELMGRLRAFTTRDVSSQVRQDVLLMAAKRDHLVPLEQFFQQARALTNARSISGRVFTEAEAAEDHCHIGNMDLVTAEVTRWIAAIAPPVGAAVSLHRRS